MYSQFFGNYLLHKNMVTQEQILKAMTRLTKSRIKLGTLALQEGLMSAKEVDECLYLQTREDCRFGEIAVQRGYLTDDQVIKLIKKQPNDFLLLGQNLVEDGAMTNSDLERMIFEYKNDTRLYDLDFDIENKEKIRQIIENFFWKSDTPIDNVTVAYLELLFNSLIRFIGDDFTPLEPISVKEYPIDFCVAQTIIGKSEYITYVDMDKTTAIEFANRYANETFEEFNEYVSAATEDFINLHNGLFAVNISNYHNQEITLSAPKVLSSNTLKAEGTCMVLPIAYSFGDVHLIVTF